MEEKVSWLSGQIISPLISNVVSNLASAANFSNSLSLLEYTFYTADERFLSAQVVRVATVPVIMSTLG